MVKLSFSKSKSQASSARRRRSNSAPYYDYRKPVHVPPSLPPKRKPSPLWKRLRPHQKSGVIEALEYRGFLLAFEQRTGKTWCTGEYLWQRDERDVLLVGLKSNLRSTWEAFLSKNLSHYRLFFSLNDYKTFRKTNKTDHAILLLNYEALTKIIMKLKRIKWGVCVMDEVQKIKKRSSDASRNARHLRHIPFRLGLSGTPMNDSPIDMWAVMRFIEPEALGITWGTFERFFVRKTGYQNRVEKFIKTRHSAFIKRVEPFVYRVTKEDAGVKRSKIKWIKVPIEGRQQRLYWELEQDMMFDVDGTVIETPLKITQIGKLAQITGGSVIDEDGEIHWIGDAKMKKLKRLLYNYDPPIAIFCKYSHEVEAVAKMASRLFDRVEMLTGKVKDITGRKRKPDDLRRTNMLEAFQRGEIDVIVSQQKTGGAGVDMYAADIGIVYSCGHSWIDFDQMTSRLDFIGKEKASKFLVLYVPGSIDEDIRTTLQDNVSITTATLNRLRKG